MGDRTSHRLSGSTQSLEPMPGGSHPAHEGWYLLVFEGDAPATFPLADDCEVVIGRAPETGLRLKYTSVSRQHARLTLVKGQASITDLESHNGTRVNGERIGAERALVPGDILSIGNISLVLRHGGAARASAQEPREGTLRIGDRTFVVADPEMGRVYRLIEHLARSDLPVLICGETGTGKEIAAAALHAWSKRHEQPLVTLNCAAMPESLVESELFGYQKGAFSGAAAAKQGLLESAAGGTVFLDEVGELPLAVQAKLLRVLETKRLTRLGEVRERAVDIRIVAATNRRLEEEIKAGRFREDLFFRLSAALLALPPLRKRPRELPLLSQIFLAEACAQAERPPMSISGAALEMLMAYEWPGNLRELKNLMGYVAATVPEPVLLPPHLSERIGSPTARPAGKPSASAAGLISKVRGPATPATAPKFRPLVSEIRDIERSRIVAALETTGGNKTRAAELIKMPLRTFLNKLKLYKIVAGRGQQR